MDTARLLAESENKIMGLMEEKRCLLTSIEVLEANVGCLRAEPKNMERWRTSLGRDAAVQLPDPVREQSLNYSTHDITDNVLDEMQLPSSASSVTLGHENSSARNVFIDDFGDVLLLGTRFFVTRAGTRGYRGGPGYNGGHGKREALHAMADLLFTARTRFPQAKVVLNSVLIRLDLTYKSLFDFNEQLELMCLNFNVEFVEANCCVGRRDLARDGIHLNRRGVSRLGSLFEDVTAELLLSSTGQAAANVNLSYIPGNEIAVNSDPAVSDAIHESQNSGN
ncbi:hypothetical protein J6590_011221 [Homalodisca vitripennis]|nr:hypothetical protein J6590_011221 [Homalodisca vitripennis]